MTCCYFRLDVSSRTVRIKITHLHTLGNSQHCHWFIVQVSLAYCKLTKVSEKLTATIFRFEEYIDPSSENTKAEEFPDAVLYKVVQI